MHLICADSKTRPTHRGRDHNRYVQMNVDGRTRSDDVGGRQRVLVRGVAEGVVRNALATAIVMARTLAKTIVSTGCTRKLVSGVSTSAE